MLGGWVKNGIVSQLLTDGIFCAAKKANEELCKSLKKYMTRKITIKNKGVQKKKMYQNFFDIPHT